VWSRREPRELSKNALQKNNREVRRNQNEEYPHASGSRCRHRGCVVPAVGPRERCESAGQPHCRLRPGHLALDRHGEQRSDGTGGVRRKRRQRDGADGDRHQRSGGARRWPGQREGGGEDRRQSRGLWPRGLLRAVRTPQVRRRRAPALDASAVRV
jgi:hypothetical protein